METTAVIENQDGPAEIEISSHTKPNVDVELDSNSLNGTSSALNEQNIDVFNLSVEDNEILDKSSNDNIWDFAACFDDENNNDDKENNEIGNKHNATKTNFEIININLCDDNSANKCIVKFLPSKEDHIVIYDSDEEAKVVMKDEPNKSQLLEEDEDDLIIVEEGQFAPIDQSKCSDDIVAVSSDQYCCTHCEQCFESDVLFKIHFNSEHANSLHECSICRKAFISKIYLDLHTKNRHNLDKSTACFVCHICDQPFSSDSDFAKHMEDHGVPVEGQQGQTDEAATSCADDKAGKLTCSFCHQHFSSSHVQKVHYICKHSNYKPYKCEICGSGFMNTQFLKTHYIMKHNYGKMSDGSSKVHVKQEIKQEKGIAIFKSTSNSMHNVCSMCKEHFDHRILYLYHMESVHDIRIKPEEENVINGKVIDRPQQRKHIQESFQPVNHMRLKFKWCVICGSKFPNNTSLLKHKLAMHKNDQSFPCDRCGKRFPSVLLLEQHVRMHCSGKTLCCSFCDRVFKTQPLLKKHIRQHIGWEYKCSLCDRLYSALSHLKRHYVTVHSDYMPYRCTFCSSRFSSALSCKSHIKRKHIDKSTVTDNNTEGFKDVITSLVESKESATKHSCFCGETFDHSILLAFHKEIKHGVKIKREHKQIQSRKRRMRNKKSSDGSAVLDSIPGSGNSWCEQTQGNENLAQMSNYVNALHQQSVVSFENTVLFQSQAPATMINDGSGKRLGHVAQVVRLSRFSPALLPLQTGTCQPNDISDSISQRDTAVNENIYLEIKPDEY